MHPAVAPVPLAMPFHVLLIAALVVACSARTDPAQELAERLYPPCCQRQTLADHDSAAAHALRAEITERVAAGESTAAIERALVERYGERIVAVEPGHDRRGLIAGVAACIIGLGLVGVIFFVRSRRRATTEPPRDESPEDADRLDDELAAMAD